MFNENDIEKIVAFENVYKIFQKCTDCSDNQEINKFLIMLSTTDTRILIKEIIKFRSDKEESLSLSAKDVPQFSNFLDSSINICEHLKYSGNKGYTFNEVGALLLDNQRSEMALKKYGENQSKTAQMLGLVYIEEGTKPRLVYISNLGSEILNIKQNIRIKIITNLILRLKIIQRILFYASKRKVIVEEEISFLARNTIIRRMPNIKKILKYLEESSETNLDYLYKEIILR